MEREDAEQFEAFSLQPFAGELGDVIQFVRQHLVDDDADNLDAVLLEEGLVQGDFVHRLADAAARDDDHLCAEHLGDLRVGQVKHRADARVAGAFTEHEVFFPRDAVEGFLDASHKRVVAGFGEILAGEVRLDGDGTHVHEGAVELVNGVHQHRVLVNLLLGDFHETLAHGLDVADARELLLQRGKQAQRGGGLAVVLPRGGDEDARREEVHAQGKLNTQS